MSSPLTFTGPGGSDPVDYTVKLLNASRPTVGDALYGGLALAGIIRERTLAGSDVNGAQFTPYSEQYAKRKTKQLGDSSIVTLFGADDPTVHMLNAMEVHAGWQEIPVGGGSFDSPDNTDFFTIGVYSEEQAVRAQAHNEGTARMPKREWLSASEENVQYVERIIGQRIDARVGGMR